MKALLISLLSLAFGAWYFLPVAPHAPAPSEKVANTCSAYGTLGGNCSLTCPSVCERCRCTGFTFGCSSKCAECGGYQQAVVVVDLAPEEVLQKARSILERDGSAVALRIAEQLDELMQLDPATEPKTVARKLASIDKLIPQLHPDTVDELKAIKNLD